LIDRPDAFREACYYETTRENQLLADFAEGPLFDRYEAGRTAVERDEVIQWLKGLASDGRIPAWSDSVQIKTARGILAALRDFGILEGAVNKTIAAPRLSPAGFAYAAFREHETGRSSRAIIESTVWRRWLLSQDHVWDLLGQVERLGILRLSRAGSTMRLDWELDTLEEVTRAAA
ncbi:MAG TPA: BrxA family protein, partial [Actinomycetota bacterium]|nr:BrxA family protein [Actinomycetota bacterium]